MSMNTTTAITSRLIVRLFGTFQNRGRAVSAIERYPFRVVAQFKSREDCERRARLLTRLWTAPFAGSGRFNGSRDEVVALGRDNLARDNVAGLDARAGNDRHAVDVGRIGIGSTEPKVLTLRTRPVDQDVEPPPDQRLVEGEGDRLLRGHEPIPAFGFDLLGMVAWQLYGRGSWLVRICERTEPLEFLLRDEFEELFKLELGLAREPDDERGAEHEPGYCRAQPCYDLLSFRPRVPSIHGPQQPVVDVLDGHVEVRHDLRRRRQRLVEFVGEVHRVVVEDADPVDSRDLVECAE